MFSIIAASVVLSLLLQQSEASKPFLAQCSNVCGCCPYGTTPSPNGDCVDSSGKSKCELSKGDCKKDQLTQEKGCGDVKTGTVTAVQGNVLTPHLLGGAPSSALSLTYMAHGIPAWSDLPGSQLLYPPQFMIGMPTFLPSSTLAGGTVITFHCPAGAGYVLCDAYVLHYHCSECDSNIGSLPSVLVAHGFEHTRCTPQFVTGAPGGVEHKMKGWKRNLLPGETVFFLVEENAELVVFGIDGSGVDCSSYGDSTSCLSPSLGGLCSWVNGECVTNKCPPSGLGPAPVCPVCVDDELPLAGGRPSR